MAKKRQIFVVEDDEAVRASTKTLLEAQGFLVRDFADAETFLDTTDACSADCIVLDLSLPGMSGLEVIALLRARGVATPVIIVSGRAGMLADRATEAGARAVLRKPLAADALLNWLEKVFSDNA